MNGGSSDTWNVGKSGGFGGVYDGPSNLLHIKQAVIMCLTICQPDAIQSLHLFKRIKFSLVCIVYCIGFF